MNEDRNGDARKIDPKLGRSRCGRRCPRPTPYVVVRFTDRFLKSSGIPYDDEVPGEKFLGAELWRAIAGGDPRVKLRSLYPAVTSPRFKAYDAFVARQSREPLPNLRGFYRITGPGDADFERIVKVLLDQREVATPQGTYVERPSLPPQVDPAGQLLLADQHYLNAPGANPYGGVNAQAVWAMAGADGAGVRFVDVERGWDLTHPDLPPQRAAGVPISLLHGINDAGFDDHGAGVLGIVGMTDADGGTNAIGGVGVAPRAAGYVSSWFMGYTDDWEEVSNIPGAILAGALKLYELRTSGEGPPHGEVLLIDAAVDQTINGVLVQVPTEANFANWDQIHRATLAGITVVEAGGNGDQYGTRVNIDPVVGANPEDSGAIIVSAAQPLAGQFPPMGWAPYGARIDCFGWGTAVATCRSTVWGSDPYTRNFGGTSAAAAMVAGAAMCLQGLARVTPRQTSGGYVPAHLLTRDQVRKALKDARWSTVATDPMIGRMPDLGRLFPALADGTLDTL